MLFPTKQSPVMRRLLRLRTRVPRSDITHIENYRLIIINLYYFLACEHIADEEAQHNYNHHNYESDNQLHGIVASSNSAFSGRGKRAIKRFERPWTMAKASIAVVILSTGSTRKPVLNTAERTP